MSIFLSALVLVGVVVLIFLPFFRREEDREDPGVAETLTAEKEEVYGSLKDIEMEYRMGKLSREDYVELHAAYRRKALGLLRAIDQRSPAALDARIEEEVAAYRRRLTTVTGREEGPRGDS